MTKNPDKPNFMREWRRMWGYHMKVAAEELGLDIIELMKIEGGAIVPGEEMLQAIADLYLTSVENLYQRNPLNTPIGMEMANRNKAMCADDETPGSLVGPAVQWAVEAAKLRPNETNPADPNAPNRIKHYRKLSGLSQAKLAEKIGCHWVHISRMERGTCGMSKKYAERIAAALGVHPGELMNWVNHESR